MEIAASSTVKFDWCNPHQSVFFGEDLVSTRISNSHDLYDSINFGSNCRWPNGDCSLFYSKIWLVQSPTVRFLWWRLGFYSNLEFSWFVRFHSFRKQLFFVAVTGSISFPRCNAMQQINETCCMQLRFIFSSKIFALNMSSLPFE